ncbi:cytochrome P450 3A11-like [Ixodes scapularis]
MWALVCTTLIAVISSLFYLWRRHKFSLFKNMGIPGPEPSLFTGNISEIIEKGAARMFDEWVNKYGDVVGFYNGVTPMLIVKDLELIKNIQIKDFGNFHGRGVTTKMYKNHQMGKLKILNADGDRWKNMRSLLTPAFSSSNVKKISSVMDACTNDVMEVLDSLSDQDKAFEIGEVYRRLSLDVMLRSAFGVESNVQKNQGIAGVNGILELIADHEDKSFTGWLPFLFNCYPEFSFIWKLYFTWSKYFISFPMDKLSYGFLPVINMRRSNPEARRDDLLQLMLNAETEEGAALNVHKLTVEYDGDVSKPTDTNLDSRKKMVLSNAEVEANAQVFLIAGTQTTRTALTFTTYLLAKFQDVQDILRSEITAVLERDVVIGAVIEVVRDIVFEVILSNVVLKARRDDLLQLMLNAETEEGAAVNVHKLTVKYDDDVSKPTDTNLNGRRKRVLSNAEVHANAQVFLIAGTETSRTALTFTSYLLAKFQDVQDRLRTEITAVLERDGKFSYDNVFSMRYLDQVISESLRFYPPVTGFITRTCQHDYEYNGLKIPAGISVLIPPYQLHHDPNLWTEPEKFDPERFSAENKGSFDPMAFQPFGNGPRNCVGLRFAQLEMKLTLAKMLAKYRFLLDERHVKEDSLKIGSTFIFCYPQEGAWLKVEKI